MNKFKMVIMILLYLLLAAFAIPMIITMFICAVGIYCALVIERCIISEINDRSLTRIWNKFIDFAVDTINKTMYVFRNKIEVY